MNARPPAEKPETESRDDEMARDFAEYHAQFPRVFELYCAWTVEFIEQGINGRKVTKLPPKFPLDVVRATTREGDQGEDRFQINGNHGRFYADLFKEAYPQLAYIFDSRERVSKKKPAVKRPALTPKYFRAVQ